MSLQTEKNSLKCPSCGEANEGLMQFCIFCGQALLPSTASFQELSAKQKKLLRVCTVCGKADPLNGQFCVLCGNQTTDNILAKAAFYGQNIARAEELKFSKPGNIGFQFSHVLILGVSLLLGLVLGTEFILSIKSIGLEQWIVAKLWPKEGLVLYSCYPNVNVTIKDAEEKFLLLGMTDDAGSLAVNNLTAGVYKVNLERDDHKILSKDMQLNSKSPVVWGYPERIK